MGFESYTPRSPEATAGKLLERVEKLRIPATPQFKDRYTDFERDMAKVSRLEAYFNKKSPEVQSGELAEALVIDTLTKGELSSLFQVRASNRYDDYFHGIDAVFDYRHGDTPALGTIDVTINQKTLEGAVPEYMRNEDVEIAEAERPVGLVQKLEKIRGYTDYLSEFDSDRARELSGWMKSGGLHERHTADNERNFKEAEKVMLLKYYLTPETSSEPLRPTYIFGGAQAVISMDSIFVNRALSGDKKAQEMVRALSFLEFAYSVHVQQEYLDKKVKEQGNRNLFFDSHYGKVNAWYRILQQPQFERVIKEYSMKFRDDPDFRKQLSYYQKTLGEVFSHK